MDYLVPGALDVTNVRELGEGFKVLKIKLWNCIKMEVETSGKCLVFKNKVDAVNILLKNKFIITIINGWKLSSQAESRVSLFAVNILFRSLFPQGKKINSLNN